VYWPLALSHSWRTDLVDVTTMLKINWVLKSDYVNCYFNQILKSIITFPQQYTCRFRK